MVQVPFTPRSARLARAGASLIEMVMVQARTALDRPRPAPRTDSTHGVRGTTSALHDCVGTRRRDGTPDANPTGMKRCALLLVAPLVVSFLAGCSADAEEENIAVGADAAELSTNGETYATGTTLQVTANLNLRKTASRTAEVLRVIPSGSTVTVWKTSGENAWVAVSSAGYKGWAHTDYLEKQGTGAGADDGDGPSGYSAARGSKLASLALRVNGRGSGGQCAKYVSNHVEDSGVKGWRRNDADPLHTYMANNPTYTRSVGFQQLSGRTTGIPKGSIVGWRRGQCGYNATYGHIEIAVDTTSSRACSDFCGNIKKTCGAPRVFQPIAL